MTEAAAPIRIAGRLPPVIVLRSRAIPSRVLALPRHVVVLSLTYGALTQRLFDRLSPPAVAVALFDPDTDVARSLTRLARLGYRGRVFVLAPPLPDAAMVEGELRAQFRSLRLRVVQLPDLAPPAAVP